MNKKIKDVKKLCIFALIVCVCFFSVAYAVLAKNLNIFTNSSIDASWNIKITDIKSTKVIGTATNSFEPKAISSTVATFGTNLISPGDSITYEITIENKGTIDALLDDYIVTETSTIKNSNIKYNISGIAKKITTLNVDEKNIIYLQVFYNDLDNSDNLKAETKDLGITFIYQQK